MKEGVYGLFKLLNISYKKSMKTNFFKYIFILFAIGIIIFAIYTIYFKENKIENEIEEVRNRTSSKNKRFKAWNL